MRFNVVVVLCKWSVYNDCFVCLCVCLEKVLKMEAEPEQVEETKEVMEVTEASSQEDSVSDSKSRWVT